MAASSLPKLPTITQISSRIIRILGGNPSPYTLQGTNSYLVGHGKNRLLIDTSNPAVPEYITSLRSVIEERGIVISNILITHWHEDHFGALPEVQDLCQELQGAPQLHKFPGGPLPSWARESGPGEAIFRAIQPLTDNQVFRVDADTTLRVLHTPGHTDDHVALWLEEEAVLFSADMILGHGSAVFESLFEYMRSLQHVQALSPPWALILSGHGAAITTPDEAIRGYLQHRQQRITQVQDALFENAMSEEMLVDKLYQDLAEGIKRGALSNTRQALRYLEKTGKAIEISPGRWKKAFQSNL